MLENTSKLGEEVYLDEEDFVELRLSSSSWKILGDGHDLTLVLSSVYHDTNLFDVVVVMTSTYNSWATALVIPKIDIEVIYENVPETYLEAGVKYRILVDIQD